MNFCFVFELFKDYIKLIPYSLSFSRLQKSQYIFFELFHQFHASRKLKLIKCSSSLMLWSSWHLLLVFLLLFSSSDLFYTNSLPLFLPFPFSLYLLIDKSTRRISKISFKSKRTEKIGENIEE